MWTRRLLGFAAAGCLALLTMVAAQPPASQASEGLVESVLVRVPPAAASGARLRVLVVLHGIAGHGHGFAEQFVEQADRNGWVLVAPTLRYDDWWKIDHVVREDTAFAHWLSEYLDRLEREHGVATYQRVLLFGFSRGAGTMGRFALLHAERVLAVAAASSGGYTMPSVRDAKGHPLAFPFGAANLAAYGGHAFDPRELRSIRWWVGVGAADNEMKDVPQVWSPSSGTTRLERAGALSAELRALGADVTAPVYPGVGHTLTHEMRTEALTFLRDAEPSPFRDVDSPHQASVPKKPGPTGPLPSHSPEASPPGGDGEPTMSVENGESVPLPEPEDQLVDS